MGIAEPPARSTLSDASNLRDWRIYHTLAQPLVARALELYAEEAPFLDLDASVYVMNRGYQDCERLYAIHLHGASFVMHVSIEVACKILTTAGLLALCCGRPLALTD